MNKYLKIAKDQALLGIKNEEGGPFGAVITRFDEVIAKGNNQVLLSHDPTAHAEIVAIPSLTAKINKKHRFA